MNMIIRSDFKFSFSSSIAIPILSSNL